MWRLCLLSMAVRSPTCAFRRTRYGRAERHSFLHLMSRKARCSSAVLSDLGLACKCTCHDSKQCLKYKEGIFNLSPTPQESFEATQPRSIAAAYGVGFLFKSWKVFGDIFFETLIYILHLPVFLWNGIFGRFPGNINPPQSLNQQTAGHKCYI